MSRKKKKNQHEEVTLNLTAMLDMAFQLLAYLILTFRSPSVEAQIALRMPDPVAVSDKKGKDVGDGTNKDPLKGLDQLVVNVYSDKAGGIGQITSGKKDKITEVASKGTLEQKMARLKRHLQEILNDPGLPFDKVALQIEGDIAYDDVMQVVDVCAQLKLHDGKPLQNVTFIELPSGKK
ncbi:MAG: biopolymer transporter ExbD [Planctomycetia bacterium]|nr:biopolymer transporter ExbD [Planctomycetia bacterium]